MNAMTREEARAHAGSIPLEQIDLSDAELFRSDTVWPYFARLRRDDPVHWRQDGVHGSFWSVTRFNDMMAVDTNEAVF